MKVKQLLWLKITILDCCPLTPFLFQFVGKVTVGLTPKVTVLLLMQACKENGLKTDLGLGEYQKAGMDFF